jgi:cell division protein FtsN
MEQKRILWITAAVGVFLLVVIGAALILYSPAHTDPVLASSALSDTTWMRLPENPSNADSALAQIPGALSAESDVTITTLPQSGVEQQASGAQSTSPIASGDTVNGLTVYAANTQVYSTGTTTIDLNTLKAQEGAKVENSVTANTTTAAASTKSVAPAVTASAPKSKPASNTAGTTAKSTAKPPLVKPAPLPDQFWVQAASFASRKNADTAREALAANKIPCEVFTHTDSRGKTFFRVRVGPYATKSEAEYWQNRIALINEFTTTQSYVTNATAKAN